MAGVLEYSYSSNSNHFYGFPKQVESAREEVFKALTAEKFDPIVYE
jgi:hypothetical protein